MNKRWITPQPIIVPDSLQEYYDVSPYLAEALAKKGITDQAHAVSFLDYNHYTPTDPTELAGVEKAVPRILSAIQKKETVGIWGDFDVDGQTSTSLLVSFFRKVDIPVHYHIPIRSKESHGILKKPLQRFLSQGIDLLITCDTGITANAALNFATQQGVDVILTDHHTLPDELPDVYSVINPHLVKEDHPFATMAGVGTAYILTRALAAELNMLEEWESSVLDLVAMGTVADVAALVQENRYMVQYGLDLMRSQPRLALRELLAVSESNAERLDEQDISFTIAPRLNALGRLKDANPIVEFLLTDDLSLTRRTATELEGLNNQRKMLVKQVYRAAEAQIEQDANFDKKTIIILANPAWPAGILGIVANHLVDAYGKPAILLSGDAEGRLKGSARSVEGINITTQLNKQAALLLSYGGHAMAAGMALKEENLDQFTQSMNANIAELADVQTIETTLPIDAYFPLENVNEAFMQILDRLAPFGAGNPAPTFLAEKLKVVSSRYLDRDKIHRSIQVAAEDGKTFEVKWWHAFDIPIPGDKIDLAYRVHRKVFRGEERIDIEWVDAHSSITEQPLAEISLPEITIQDFRFSKAPLEDLQAYMQQNPAVCWGENLQANDLTVFDRTTIPESISLIFLHIPPAAEVMRQILQKVHPTSIALFNLPQKPISVKKLLQNLLGMVKFAIHEKGGSVSLEQYASLTGLTTNVIDTGLSLLAAGGQIIVQTINEDEKNISMGKKSENPIEKKNAQEKLIQSLREIQTFQRFLLRLPPENILSEYIEKEK